MPDMTLSGDIDRPRNMLAPVLLALLVLAAAGAWFARTYVHPSVTGKVDSVKVFPLHIAYQHQGRMVGADQSEDAIYVVATATITGRTEVPLFIKGLSGSYTTSDGSSIVEANVIDKDDLPRLLAGYPQLKAITDATGLQPLTREQTIPAGATASGWIIMLYNFTPEVWNQRKSAQMTIDFYHQDPMTLQLPK